MRTIFVKSNCQYDDPYCVVTRIEEEDGVRRVRKSPMLPASREHVRNMALSAQELPALLPQLEICPCEETADGVTFPFIQGNSWYAYLVEQGRLGWIPGMNAWESFFRLLEPAEALAVPFAPSPAFEAMFGSGEAFLGERAYPLIALDLTPSNVLMRGNQRSMLIDYEWRVPAPVPVALVKYHALTATYRSFEEMRRYGPPLGDVMRCVGLTAPEAAYEDAMERCYQRLFRQKTEVLAYFQIKHQYMKPVHYTCDYQYPGRRLLRPAASIVACDAPASLTTGQAVDIRVTVENDSSEPWSENDRVRLCILHDGADTGDRLNIADGVAVMPHERYTFVHEGVTLPEDGDLSLTYQMLQEGVTYFGEPLRVDIRAEAAPPCSETVEVEEVPPQAEA